MLTVMVVLMLLTTPSPLNMSLLLTGISVTFSVFMALSGGSTFLASIMLISFSTGMMILFCYSASLSPMEKKNKDMNNKSMILLMTASLFLTMMEYKKDNSLEISSFLSKEMVFLTIVILMIFICMMSINKIMFTKKFMLMKSYLSKKKLDLTLNV